MLALITSALLLFQAQTPNPDPVQLSAAKLAAAKAIEGTMVVTFPKRKPQTWTFRFLKPNLYEIIAPDQQFRSDGTRESIYLPGSAKTVRERQYQFTDRTGPQITDAPLALGLNQFFAGAAPLENKGVTKTDIEGKPAVGASLPQVGFKDAAMLYIDPATQLPIGYDQPQESGTLTVRYTNLKLDPPLTAATFAWSPPVDAKPIGAASVEAMLLAAGADAPGASLPDSKGAKISLADEFRSHKSTLLYFWSGPAPIPDAASLRDFYTRLNPQKLQVIVIEFGPAAADSAKNLAAAGFTMPVVIDADSAVAKAYGVQAQSEFLVGSDGKVIAHFLGFDADGITKSLRKMGFLI
jgi:peroxiredoxin/outer membrane lipoprotein-sorting protein